MNIEELLQEILKLTPEQRRNNNVLFDYKTNKFIPLPDLQVCCDGRTECKRQSVRVCVDGEPEFHLTINTSNPDD